METDNWHIIIRKDDIYFKNVDTGEIIPSQKIFDIINQLLNECLYKCIKEKEDQINEKISELPPPDR